MSEQNNNNGFMGWIDARFPLTKMWEEHLSKYYAPKNFNFWYFFGSLALVVIKGMSFKTNQAGTCLSWLLTNRLWVVGFYQRMGTQFKATRLTARYKLRKARKCRF